MTAVTIAAPCVKRCMGVATHAIIRNRHTKLSCGDPLMMVTPAQLQMPYCLHGTDIDNRLGKCGRRFLWKIMSDTTAYVPVRVLA